MQVAPDSRFGRDGNDLTTKVLVGYPDAALGATISVPTMEGTVTVRLPAGTRSGRTFRVKGKGVKGGDLLVTVEVAVPATLTDRQRTLLEELRTTLQEDS